MTVLITGISGILGRLTAQQLQRAGHHVIGIDRRPWPDAPKDIEMVRADMRKRPAEDVFRTRTPEIVVHLDTVTHFGAGHEERYRINLGGTRSVFDHCHRYGASQAIFVSRHTVYGAAEDTPLYRTEDDPPMAASTFPELADLVAADLYAGSAIWRYPDITTSVLRLVYTLGPSRTGPLARYLSGAHVPTVLGFDPLFHFFHEQDAACAIAAAVEAKLRGVFNVAGPQPVPLSLLCKVTGRRVLPLPDPLFFRLQGRFGLAKLPRGARPHVKYPVVIQGKRFREATGWRHEFDEVQTMEAFAQGLR